MVKSIKQQMKPTSFKEQPLNKSKGILDDFAVRKDMQTREGTIQHTPTNPKDIVNKEYVDDITIGTYFDFYAYDDDSDVAGYKEFKLTPSSGAEVENSVNVLANATEQLAGARITEDTIDIPDLITLISAGVFTFHVHLRASTAKRLKVYTELYKRTALGVETLITTTIPTTEFIGTVDKGYNSHGDIETDVVLNAGDRLVVKAYAINVSPVNTTLYIAVEGDTATRVNLPGITTPANHAGLINLDYASSGHTGFLATADKYTDAEAVTAVATADDYLKNDADDTTTGTITAGGFTTAGAISGATLATTGAATIDGTLTLSQDYLYLDGTANRIISDGDNYVGAYGNAGVKLGSVSGGADTPIMTLIEGGQIDCENEIDAKAGITTDGLNIKEDSVTISAGAVAYGSGNLQVNPETGTSDSLNVVTGGTTGDILILSQPSSANTINIAHNYGATGDFRLAGGATITLANALSRAMFIYDSSGQWCEISRSNNA